MSAISDSGITLGPVHHLRLTVTDVERSRAFYTDVLGLQVAMDGPPPSDDPHHDVLVDSLQGGIVLMGSGFILGLRPADAERQAAKDRFDPFRIGLDHLSFNVPDRAALAAARERLAQWGVPHGEIAELPPFALAVLSFEDPDGIQLELSAPM